MAAPMNFLVPLDGSTLAEQVLPHIECLGKQLRSQIKLLRVVEHAQVDTAKATLATLKGHQSQLGQIPNYLSLDSGKPNRYAVDATAWWIIAGTSLAKTQGEGGWLRRLQLSIDKAITWLDYRVVDTSGLMESPSSADWMDVSVERRGKVFYNNLLYHRCLALTGAAERVIKVGDTITSCFGRENLMVNGPSPGTRTSIKRHRTQTRLSISTSYLSNATTPGAT